MNQDFLRWAHDGTENALAEHHGHAGVDGEGEFQGDFKVLGWDGWGAYGLPDRSPGPGPEAEGLRLLGLMATEEDMEEILHEGVGSLLDLAEEDPMIDLLLRIRWAQAVAAGKHPPLEHP